MVGHESYSDYWQIGYLVEAKTEVWDVVFIIMEATKFNTVTRTLTAFLSLVQYIFQGRRLVS